MAKLAFEISKANRKGEIAAAKASADIGASAFEMTLKMKDIEAIEKLTRDGVNEVSNQ